jgi:Fe2+ or Zn2+ uptake regulation protein
MTDNVKQVLCDIVDLLMPELTPYETSLYLLLYRLSYLENGDANVRIGKRTVAERLKSSRAGAKISFAQVTDVLRILEEKGCVMVGDTNREGTLYTVVQPRDIPFVKEKLATTIPSEDDDYFNNAAKRAELFERDKWICQYCGEKVTKENATLDHYIPQSKQGGHSKDNLRTSCLLCNSIKSGKTYEEAAPLLLKSIQERRQRVHK